jgi:uncharacterized protein (DUF1684 family)
MFGHLNQADGSYMREIEASRHEKDRFFALSPQSPVPHEHRHGHFSRLRYFPPDPAFRVEAEVVVFRQPESVPLATSTGEMRPQVRYAELRFVLSGRELRLSGFADPHEHHAHELFVPFRDATSGRETYGAGRYLEVELVHHADGAHTATLDFNLAYNPYCAYNPHYSCPIPPGENRLPVAIAAGEQAYDVGH